MPLPLPLAAHHVCPPPGMQRRSPSKPLAFDKAAFLRLIIRVRPGILAETLKAEVSEAPVKLRMGTSDPTGQECL